MISTWSDWKRYPRPGRGDNIEAPITPGIYEVRIAATGALYSFGAVDNVAQALALLPVGHKSWFGRRDPATLPDLEDRTCATSTKADAVPATVVAAVDLADGQPDSAFTPRIFDVYPGCWTLTSTPGALWVGGDFTGELQNGANNNKPFLAAYPGG